MPAGAGSGETHGKTVALDVDLRPVRSLLFLEDLVGVAPKPPDTKRLVLGKKVKLYLGEHTL